MDYVEELKKFDKTIIKLAKTYTIKPLDWEDIAQELRVHLWKNREKYDPNRAEFKNWAYILCRNKIRDLARYYKAKKRDSSKDLSLEMLEEEGKLRI